MLWIALAVAAQLSAPVPLNLKSWFHVADEPTFLYKEALSGFWLVGLRITVRPDGTIQRCVVTNSAGPQARIAELTCKLVMQRAHFQPARLSDNTAAYGVYESTYAWRMDYFHTKGMSLPQLHLDVKGLPDAKQRSALVRVMFEVDSDGRFSSCMADRSPSFENVTNDPQLVQVACEQLPLAAKYAPVRDERGEAVPSVQNAVVQFEVPTSPR